MMHTQAWIQTVMSGLLGVFILGTYPAMAAQSPQCYHDASAAYAALLKAERYESQAQQQVRNNAVVNINTASEGELTTLAGIGSSKAQAIILYREMFGDFESIEDITKVKGIGTKTFENNKHRLQVR